jgi:hypothetical protein
MKWSEAASGRKPANDLRRATTRGPFHNRAGVVGFHKSERLLLLGRYSAVVTTRPTCHTTWGTCKPKKRIKARTDDAIVHGKCESRTPPPDTRLEKAPRRAVLLEDRGESFLRPTGLPAAKLRGRPAAAYGELLEESLK